ncbi:MAG: hypothetical protein HQL75_00210 [Magnetococcales bacterium]|nr:hypothetical protein [Magnetococcales bacterium]
MINSIISVNLSQSEGDFLWTGSIELTNPLSFHRIKIGDKIDLELGGELFKLIVDNKSLNRDGVNNPSMTVSVASPTARFSSPRAKLISKVWNEPVWSRLAAESVIGEYIEWQLVDWMITGGQLAVDNASPIDIIRTIASAAGGMVESKPDGTLKVRNRFPVPVPQWDTAFVDHVLTDEYDNLSCTENHIFPSRVDKVVIRSESASKSISAEVDSRRDGFNGGRTTFFPGDTVYILVFKDDGVNLEDPMYSDGNMRFVGERNIKFSQDVTFSNTNVATLNKQSYQIENYIWIGRGLGSLSLSADRKSVVAEYSGVGIARVNYYSHATVWALTSPFDYRMIDSETVHEITFSNANSVTLDRPVDSIKQFSWTSGNLGNLTLLANKRTILAERMPVPTYKNSYKPIAKARVTLVSSAAQAVAKFAEYASFDIDVFPILTRFGGSFLDGLGAGELICQRGDGEFSGEDITDPLLTTELAKRSRGQAEIDSGESLQEVSLTCIHRPGFMPGQLVEVHDALFGKSWRGKITGVTHDANQTHIVTSLEIVRYYESQIVLFEASI